MMHITFEDGSKTEFEGFDFEIQVTLLGLIAKHLSYDEDTKSKFTTALNAFTKLRFKDKEQEIDVWIETMENILENGKQNKGKRNGHSRKNRHASKR